jgi:hypothetical protein
MYLDSAEIWQCYVDDIWIICQMIFLVVDTNNYDLFFGLDFFIRIRIVIDVEKGVIQVHNGLKWKWRYCH